MFFDKCLEVWGKELKMVMIAPMGFRLNQRMKSTRWKKLRDCGVDITSILSLPLDIFPGVQFHSEVLFFNIEAEKSHFFLDVR